MTLLSESQRNVGRIWVPENNEDNRKPAEIPEEKRDYYLEMRYSIFENLAPRDSSSKERIDAGHGVGTFKNLVYLDFKNAVDNFGKKEIEDHYASLFSMSKRITIINTYEEPMKISPAAYFSMSGLWVDYEIMTTISGLYPIGECNYSDHGANRNDCPNGS